MAVPSAANAAPGSLTNTVEAAIAQLDFANGLYRRQFYDMALVEYIRFTQKFDNHPLADEVYYRMAECHRTLKHLEEARKAFLTVTKRWPSSDYSGRAHFRLGEMAYEAKKLPEAITMFTAAVHQTADEQVRVTSQFYLAKSQLESNEPDQALENFRRVLKSKMGEPFRPYAESAVAALYLKSGDTKSALAAYENVLRLDVAPELREEALYQVGVLRLASKSYPKAAEALRQFIKDYPKSRAVGEVAIGLARALFASGKNRECAQVAREWYDIAPQPVRPELAMMVAGALRDEKAYREAADWYAKAATPASLAEEVRCAFLAQDYTRVVLRGEALMQSDPKNPHLESVMLQVAEALESQHLWQRSGLAYRALLDKFPQTTWATDALWHASSCWQQAGKLDEAVKDFEKLATAYPKDSRHEAACYQVAACYGQLDKFEPMIAAFTKLLTLYPQGVYAAEAHYWVGANHFQRQQWADAVTHLEKALSLRPADNRKRVSPKLMVAYYKLGQADKAGEHLQALLDRGESKQIPAEISAWLGEKLLATEKYEAAAPHLERALKAGPEPAVRASTSESLSRIYIRLNQWDKVAGCLRDVIEIEGATARGMRASINLADALIKMGDYQNAQQALEKLIEKHPEGAENARIRMLLGDLYAALRNFPEAARYYMNVAVLYDDPQLTPDALDRAAAAFVSCGRTGDALQAKRELEQRYPNYKPPQSRTPALPPKKDAPADATKPASSQKP